MSVTTTMDVIDSFEGRYQFLSNFYPEPVTLDGVTAPTAEHHYHAAKTTDPGTRSRVYATETPGKAKAMGRYIRTDSNWEASGRYLAMEAILRAKFSSPDLRAALLDTGTSLLVEGNNWHDQEWGDCHCPRHAKWPGKSTLGRMLMALRAEYRGDPAATFTRVALTGHRPEAFTPEQAEWVRSALATTASYLKDHGTRVAISALAQGADTWWAEAALAQGLDLWAYLPTLAQADRWSPERRGHWADLRREATRQVCLSREYDIRAYHARNDLMIRDADLVVAVHLREKRHGGTAETIRRALKRGKPMLRLNATDHEVTQIAGNTHGLLVNTLT